MSKKTFKSQASSSRASASTFGAQTGSNGIPSFGSPSALGVTASSSLSYIYEPLDLSAIPEPNMIVALKNLQKKDSATKSKALEELQTHLSSVEAEGSRVEEAIVEAWVKLYPRTSIDSARQVRRLAHIVQGQISVSCGKRIARHIPQVIGSWLAGLFDNDRSVARAALDSLKIVFTSDEKMKNVWRVYLPPIVRFASDAVTNETPDTLSDERTTKPDDAAAKHARLVGTMISMVTKAIDEFSASNQVNEESLISEFLHERKLWDFAAHQDPFVRRSVYRLAVEAARNLKENLDPSLVSATMLKKALAVQQTGSAFEYARALTTLTSEIPTIWSYLDELFPKKSACQRLCEFLKKGSQAGPPEYWDQISTLGTQLPLEVLLPVSGTGNGKDKATFPVLEALHVGLMSSDEPRANQTKAWYAYLETAARLVSSLSSQTSRDELARHSLVPIVNQYVEPLSDESQWTIGGSQKEEICLRSVHQIYLASPEILQETWSNLSRSILEGIEKPRLEQSKDNSKPEDLTCACIIRWYGLQTAVFKSSEPGSQKGMVSKNVVSELNAVLQILQNGAGEAYSAAVILENAITMPPEVFRHEDKVMSAIANFAQHHIPKLLLSPSAPHLIGILTLLTDVLEVSLTCEAGVEALRNAPDSAPKSLALKRFVASRFLAQAKEGDILKDVVRESLEEALQGNESKWELVLAALGNPAAPKSLVNDLLARMTLGFSIKGERLASLRGLGLILERKSPSIKAFVGFSSESHLLSKLLSKLLFLAESPYEELSIKAQNIIAALESCLAIEKDSSYSVSSMINVINEGIDLAGPESLSVDSLVRHARRLLDQSVLSNRATLLASLLPSPTQWSRAMMPLLAQSPSFAFSHISPLGGAIALINSDDQYNNKLDIANIDQNGYSLAFRMVRYTIELFRDSSLIDLARPDQMIILKNLALVHQSATQSLSAHRPSLATENLDADRAPERLKISADIDYMLKAWEDNEPTTKLSLIPIVQQQLLDDSRGTSPASYYSACAFLFLESEHIKHSRLGGLELNVNLLESLRKPSDIFTTLATWKITTDAKLILKALNNLLADFIGYDFEKRIDAGLRQLVLLNCLLDTKVSQLITKIPKQRLVLFVKNSVRQLHKGKLSKQLTDELLKALSALTPLIRDVHDSFWGQMIDFINNALLPPNQVWDDDNISILHATLELLATLGKLLEERSNEGLEDAWMENEKLLIEKLFSSLKDCQGISDDYHIPRHKVNCLLAQQLIKFSREIGNKITELYAVLACESSALQLAAYHILHYQIPNAQEQISLEKALEKEFYAKLPEELLSLIITAPNPDLFDERDFARAVSHPLRSYLLSWKLIFDHWTNSSDKTKADYAAGLKEGSYLQSLLNFIFQICISNRTKPLDASAIDKSSFEPGASNTLEDETHELLVHLYYLSLKYLPSLCRSWWRDTTSRQTAIAVETWTEKYISPLIITSELQAISAWAPSQSNTEQPMEIKVSHSAQEITASIPLDDQSLQIAIRLPPSYPLARASVDSLHRVAVDEKKWRGWLIATQGVINFTVDGGQPVVEGLLAWRRNVTATLKGQTECAICYSVVGGDRQLPSKRCGTCKNYFHGSCLFKWFKSSNSSSCPLCRNAFNYA